MEAHELLGVDNHIAESAGMIMANNKHMTMKAPNAAHTVS